MRNLSSLLTVCEHAAYETVDNEDEVTSQIGLPWDQSDGLYSYQTFTQTILPLKCVQHRVKGICVKIFKDTVYKSKNNMLWLSKYHDNKELTSLILYEVSEFYLLTLSTKTVYKMESLNIVHQSNLPLGLMYFK